MGGPGSGRKPSGRRSFTQRKKVNTNKRYKFVTNRRGITRVLKPNGRLGKIVRPDSSD